MRSASGTLSRGCPSTPRRAPARVPHAIPELYLAAKLAFLPYNGCAVPGSPYSTGVQGVPGIDCQKLYTPAAEAEKRFVERLKAQAASSPSVIQEASSTTRRAPAGGSAPAPTASTSAGGSAPAIEEAASSATSAAVVDEAYSAAAAPAAGEGFVDTRSVRMSLAQELRERNRQLVEAAWQSLE